MRRVSLKTWRFVPKAVIMPRWLRKLPPFNKLVYCERTYSNDYTSNTWTIVVLMKRKEAELPRVFAPLPWWAPFSDCKTVNQLYSWRYSLFRTCIPRGFQKPVTAVITDEACRAVVYSYSSLQSACLIIKTAFAPDFWVSVVRDAKHSFKLNK